jgi:hypothetical protein
MRPSHIACSCGAALACVCLLWAGPAPEPPQYVFVENTKGWVALIHGDTYATGKLDKDGTFVPDRRYPEKTLESLKNPGSGLLIRFLNDKPGPAYEYRSGRLIRGEIDTRGIFIPELGCQVIALEAYHYRPGSMPIYNLPGWFVPKDKRKEKGTGDEKGKEDRP